MVSTRTTLPLEVDALVFQNARGVVGYENTPTVALVTSLANQGSKLYI